MPIFGLIVRAKGLRVSSLLNQRSTENTKQFQASGGWLSAFKKRHGIHSLYVQGESLSADSACVSSYVGGLQIQFDERGECAEQIYNADETALYLKAVPRKTLVAAFEQSAPGIKECKQRVSILLCCNATGSHKLKPLLIGEYRNPRCLKHANRLTLPVIYRHQSNMWMTQEIFAEWFHNYFVLII